MFVNDLQEGVHIESPGTTLFIWGECQVDGESIQLEKEYIGY